MIKPVDDNTDSAPAPAPNPSDQFVIFDFLAIVCIGLAQILPNDTKQIPTDKLKLPAQVIRHISV